MRASGEVEMSCVAGGRYTVADLAALTGASLRALKGLVADRAHYHLTKRRYPDRKIEDIPGAVDSKETLDRLRLGEIIFGLQEVADAGQMDAIDVSTGSDGVDRRLTTKFSRLFGRRVMDDKGF